MVLNDLVNKLGTRVIEAQMVIKVIGKKTDCQGRRSKLNWHGKSHEKKWT